MFINKILQLNNSKTRTAMNAKIPVFVICIEAIIYLLLYNLHDCTFKTVMKTHSYKHFILTFSCKVVKKGHKNLNKPVTKCCRFVQISTTFCYHPTLKELIDIKIIL